MRNQRGVTMIGWIFLLIPIAVVLYAGLRVGPEYFNYYKVVQAMKTTAKALEQEETLSPNDVHNALERRFDTGYIDKPKPREIQVSKNAAGGWQMTADYETTVDLFGNLHMTMIFNKSVNID